MEIRGKDTNTGIRTNQVTKIYHKTTFFFRRLHLSFYRNEGERSYGESGIASVFSFRIIGRIDWHLLVLTRQGNEKSVTVRDGDFPY